MSKMLIYLILLAITSLWCKPQKSTQPESRLPVFNKNNEAIDFSKNKKQVWKKALTKKQFEVCRNSGTEPAFSGQLLLEKRSGVFYCSSCNLPLFSSNTKFNSGSGWPSFYKPLNQASIKEIADHSYGMTRTEVKCSRCDAHLGHVFNDGPKPTGLRYCINSVCLKFKKKN